MMNKASALASVALSSHLAYPLPVAGNETVHPGSLLPSSSMLNCSQVQSSQRYHCWCPLAGALQHGFRRQQIHSRLLARLSPAFFRRRSRRGIIDIERHRDYGHESRVFLSSSFLSYFTAYASSSRRFVVYILFQPAQVSRKVAQDGFQIR